MSDSLLNSQFSNKKVLAKIIGCSVHTLKAFRLRGDWIEGVHYTRINSRSILYNLPLCIDWIANRNNPLAHQQAIEKYLASLPCNQPKKRGRRVD